MKNDKETFYEMKAGRNYYSMSTLYILEIH